MRALILASCTLAAAPVMAQPAPAAPAPAEAPPAEAAPATPPAPRTMGTLLVDAGQDGVPVIVDGVDIGRTPLPGPWTLPPGPHTVVLRPEGASPEKHDVQIPVGGEVRLEVLTAPV
ncbi:MAG: PEGA domain-containing protein, partial [Myxococcales bacterium]|nr:PEGA domain-containing protein [Myxococcales bacterium]